MNLMSLLSSLLAGLWAVWGLLSFIVTFLLILIPSLCTRLIPDPVRAQRAFIRISRIWMHSWLGLIGCPLRIRGTSHFRPGQHYVVVFNHRSLLDIPLSAPFTPGANRTIGKKSFAYIPLFGWFYRMGAILVDRRSETSRRKSYELMRQTLTQGMHVCIYPEGTRNRSRDTLKPFYDGAFRLARESGSAIIPCLLSGTAEALPPNRTLFLRPTRLRMRFLPPVSSMGKTTAELRDEVHALMKHGLEHPETIG